MERLIDTITPREFSDRPSITKADLRDRMESLFARPKMWYDDINHEDRSTWVLCFVSDSDRDATTKARWIARRYKDSYGPINTEVRWTYARPVSQAECYQEEKKVIAYE